VRIHWKVTYALTPALSPEEREDSSPRFGVVEALGFYGVSPNKQEVAVMAKRGPIFKRMKRLFPLPGGEG